MIRFTILADSRSAVMGAALVAIAALPLFVTPLADPYQPVRTLVAGLATGLLVVFGVRYDGRLVHAARILGFTLGIWVLCAAILGGPASAIFGIHGRYQGLVSGAVLLMCGAAGLSLRGGDMRTLARGLAFVGAIVSAAVVAQAVMAVDPVAWMNNRVVTGGWLAVAAGVGVGWVAVTSGKVRMLAAGSLVLVMLALGVVASRGAWVAVVASMGAIALMLGRNRRRDLVIAATLALVLIGGAVSAGPQALGKLDPRSLSVGSALSRSQIWAGTVDLIADHPLWGVGPGRFLYEFPAYQSTAHAATESVDTRPDQAHSWPLQISAESGLPAGVLVAVLSVLALMTVLRDPVRRDGAALLALGGFVAYAVQALFSVPSIEVDALGWLLGGVLISRGAQMSARTPHRMPARLLPPIMLSGAVVVVSILYMNADVAHTRGVKALAAGDFATARSSSLRAVELNPSCDVYRVAYSDAVIYEPSSVQRERTALAALPVVREGLRLEPASYDLALATARLTVASGAPDGRVADAYLTAVRLYPLGVEVREYAADALDRAGRADEAETLRSEVRELLAARGEGK